MHSTRDATLQLIQREITEVVQREKELKDMYSKLDSNKNVVLTNGLSKSSKIVSNGDGTLPNNVRLFTQNPSTKGAMHRFIKSRGRSSGGCPTYDHKVKPTTWATPNTELGKPLVPVGVQPRNGFVPIGERLRKEFTEMEERETELVIQRTKSQPDLLVLLSTSTPEPPNSLQSSYSVSRLSDSTYESGSLGSPPLSLKPARSLADLCDVDDAEESPPGSVNLIKRWEGIIQKNS